MVWHYKLMMTMGPVTISGSRLAGPPAWEGPKKRQFWPKADLGKLGIWKGMNPDVAIFWWANPCHQAMVCQLLPGVQKWLSQQPCRASSWPCGYQLGEKWACNSSCWLPRTETVGALPCSQQGGSRTRRANSFCEWREPITVLRGKGRFISICMRKHAALGVGIMEELF